MNKLDLTTTYEKHDFIRQRHIKKFALKDFRQKFLQNILLL